LDLTLLMRRPTECSIFRNTTILRYEIKKRAPRVAARRGVQQRGAGRLTADDAQEATLVEQQPPHERKEEKKVINIMDIL